MPLLLTLLLASLAVQYLPKTEVSPLSFDAEAFKSDFNAAVEQPRLVAVFSPT